MKTSHLSDQEIQRFVFDKAECDSAIIAHIHSCEVCQARTAPYHSLSNLIKDQQDPVIEFDLAQLVLDQLESSAKQETSYRLFIYFLITASIGLVVSSLYFIGVIFIDLFKNTNSSFLFFIISIALLITITLVIDLVRSFNKKIKMINFY